MKWCLCKGVTLLWVKISLHPWLYKPDLTSCDHITLGIAPFYFKGAVNFGLGKCFIFIKSSIIAGSIAPSDNEEDIYYGRSLPRPVYVPPCSLSALPTTPPWRSVIMRCCRTLQRRKRWSLRNPWRRDGPHLPTCWRCVGGHSWRNYWQWRAPGPAAGIWWSAALWSGGGSPWRWPGACAAAGPWTPAWCALGPGYAQACSAPAPSACKLQADGGKIN